MDNRISIIPILFFLFSILSAQTNTIGLIQHDPQAYPGYNLFAPLTDSTTYLIDNDGQLIHQWNGHFKPGNSVYLLEDGILLRTCDVNNPVFTGGGKGGRVQRVNWDGSIVWNYKFSSDIHCQHHDVEYLPNGNILMIAWEYKSKQEVVASGRKSQSVDAKGLWCDFVVEVKPKGIAGGEIVWAWHVWDHLIQDFDSAKNNYGVISEHPELIDINFVSQHPDWNHINAIDYNDLLDQISLSVREFSEFWIIERSSSSVVAQGHDGGKYGKGGDLLYRWGNPRAYGFGSGLDQKLYYQHDVQWIPDSLAGGSHILVFNNGDKRPEGDFSTIEEIETPVDGSGNYNYTPGTSFLPASSYWSYMADPDTSFFSSYISGCQRLPNGNTLICEGAYGTFFEVTASGETVWKYINPVASQGILTQGESPKTTGQGWNNSVFRVYRYGSDYPAFQGKDMSPNGQIELYPITIESVSEFYNKTFKLYGNFPNPFNNSTMIGYELLKESHVEIKIYDIRGALVTTLMNENQQKGYHETHFEANHLATGIYVYYVMMNEKIESRKMLLVR